jgi:dihydrolipoamide dehydrogenase
MSRYDYNVIVLGGGSAGLVAAYIAAALKAKVALIEKHKMGGDCLNTGCVPSKALLRSAKMLAYARRAKEFGFTKSTVDFDFAGVMQRVHNIIATVAPHDSEARYASLGVDCISGEAKITAPHCVSVNGQTLTTRAIIVATGARPLVPPIPGLDQIDYLTSDNIWNLKELPQKLVVLGGGPIGSEMAQAFLRLGAAVTLVEMAPQILIREDNEAIQIVTERFKKEGMTILTNHKAKLFKGQTLVCEHAGQDVSIPFDKVLVALGRKANVSGFGLEELGASLNPQGALKADMFLQTNIPGIYVCGDVTGPYQFTHTAGHQAWYASVNALFHPFKKFKADYRVIPWATFTDPEVARVGLNEKDAQTQNQAYEVTTYSIDDLDRAITDSEAQGFVKILTAPGKDKILGVTIVGPHAGDLIAEYVLAMKHGIGLNKILGTIHIYPTLAEANKYAAGMWKKAHLPARSMKLLEKFHVWRR